MNETRRPSSDARHRPSVAGQSRAGGAAEEPIAIVGMACRFPGAPDLDAYWGLLESGTNAITEGEPGSGIGRVGELYTDPEVQSEACRFGAFIEDIDLFDAEFFRISPVEAQLLDPQQRLMLETSWQAFEDAGMDPTRLQGSRTGIYIGISNMDYRLLNLESAQTAESAASLYAVSGTSLNTAAGRVAFALGLEGPAMAVDTACSSSLVALHQGASALHRGEADLVLAGGVQAILSGRLTELRANAGMLSPDGKCKAFDATANGFVRGEGCGIVVLKRLSEAEADGDRIWGLILGSALNQDGTSSGLTVPSGPAQKGVITEALRRSGVDPSEIDYLEAHGTGTEVGDPIELNAAAEAYGKGRPPDRPLLVGSVKTNFGHLEPAAGVAGLIKVVLAMRKGAIPKHLHFRDPNPRVEWDRLPLKITSELTRWPSRSDRPARAGISAYGWSGTNAHVIVEGYGADRAESAADWETSWPVGPSRPAAADGPTPVDGLDPRPARLLPLAARSESALQELAERYLAWLEGPMGGLSDSASAAESDLADVAWTASDGRTHFDYRTGVVFRDLAALRAGLRSVGDGGDGSPHRKASRIAFAYTGQGVQWVGMGEALYRSEPVARSVLDRCDRIIRGERGASLLDVMFGKPGETGDLDDPQWTQPAVFALQCALTALWDSLGVRPSVVLGHSFGEIAAAYAAGAISLEDGLRFASTRGRLMGALPGEGAMAAVFAPARRVAEEVAAWNERCGRSDMCVAVDNGTHQVVSGPASDVEPFADRFEAEGVNVRRLRSSPAYHSPLVEPALDGLEEFCSSMDLTSPELPLVSNVTGKALPPGQTLDGPYWRRQAREPVAFRSSVETLAELGVDAVIELGPHAVLGPLVSLNWPQDGPDIEGPVVLQSLLRPSWDGSEPERADAFLSAVAGAYGAGLPVSLAGLFAGESRRRVALPGYPFQRMRHWVPSPRRRLSKDADPLLGIRHESPHGTVMYETEMSPSDPAWLSDHRVFDRVIMPGAIYGAMATAAAAAEGDERTAIEDLQLHSPLVFPLTEEDDPAEVGGRRIQLTLDEERDTGFRGFEIFSRDRTEEGWTLHAAGKQAKVAGRSGIGRSLDLTSLTSSLESQDLGGYYRTKAASGIDFGPCFRSLTALWGRPGEALAEVTLPQEAEAGGRGVHPLLLDGCFQVLSAARNLAGAGGNAAYLPFGWERLQVDGQLPEQFICHARMRDADPAGDQAEATVPPETLTGDLWIYSTRGDPLGELTGFTVKRATRTALLSAAEDLEELLYEVVWRDCPLPGGLKPADGLATPEEICRRMSPFADYLGREGVAMDDRAALLLDLERLSRAYALAALEQLGWRRRAGEAVEPQDFIEGMGVDPEHTQLLARLLGLVRDAGLLERAEGEGYMVAADADDPLPDEALADPSAFAQTISDRYPHGHNELGLVRRSGEALADGLRGTVDPLDLLFRSEGPGVTEYYFAAPASRAANRLLADAVAQVVREWPDERPLRVLEVGAGTGSATAGVLPELPAGRVEYLFTDISAGFFAEAESRFADSGIPVQYRPLDIEKHPSGQGFELHGYDLIIAANVLHATRYLGETLDHCRELLAPSGQLIALENMRGRGWQDIAFGLLDGWWRFDDEFRPNHAMAPPPVWCQTLLDSGYVEVGFLGIERAEEDGPLGSSVFLARGPEQITEPPGLWVIASDGGGVGAELARGLAARNQTIVLAESADRPAAQPVGQKVLSRVVAADDRQAWRELLEGLPDDVALQGVVHMAALDGHGTDSTTAQLLEDTRRAGSSALALVQALLDTDIAPEKGLWLTTLGAQALERDYLRTPVGELSGAALWGFGKAVAREAGHLRPRMLDLDPGERTDVARLADELMNPDRETHVAYRSGQRLTARLVRSGAERARIDLPQDPDWQIAPGSDGGLEDLRAKPIAEDSPGPDQVRIAVDAVGVNFLDVLLGMGIVGSADPQMGEEFCGRIVELGSDVAGLAVGDRVVGLGFGTFAPEVVTHSDLVIPTTSTLPAAALATIPSAFASAGLSFEMVGLRPGDRVLVHTASGGVGLAAIQLATAAGAEVLATASQQKHAYLRSLGITHVFDSRTPEFGDRVLAATDGAGVDVVLNTLTGPGFIEASLSCLAESGRFVEMGRRGIWSHEDFAEARPDVDYFILELDTLKKDQPARPGAVLQRVMDRISTGELHPPAHVRWPVAESRAAMEFMRSTRHIGKNVLAMPPLVSGRLRAEGTYLVTGGLGGIGAVVAGWLAENGAGAIVLNGRRPPDPAAADSIEALRRQGANVQVEIADVTDPEAVDAMLERIGDRLPPLAGIIHSVGVLSDGALGNQNWDRFEAVLWPKIAGAWQLHRATLQSHLDMFVLFSSITGVLGNSGQGNHAAANSFLDQLAAYRRSLGLPGQAIAWGAWSGLGEAEEQRQRIEQQLASAGTGWISPQQGIRAFGQLVRQDLTAGMVAVVDWPKFAEGADPAPPLLEDLLPAAGGSGGSDGDEMSAVDQVAQILQSPAAEREKLLTAFVQGEVQAVLRLPSPPAPSVGFFELGMDSLMSVELRNRLNRALAGELVVSATAVFDYPNVASLARHLTDQLGQDRELADPEPITAAAQSQSVEGAIAIVGMACRLPGAPDLASFWNLLETGASAVTDGRLDPGPWTGVTGDPNADDATLRRGGFVEGIDRFDARFFRIAPIEARTMDPQQRMLLETSWQALEDAAIDPDRLRGSRTGVFAGVGSAEYRDLIATSRLEDSYLGTAASVAVGRVAFALGLEGPAMPVDMACTSSLAAVHQAAEALRRDEVDLALVGGVNATLSPSFARFHRDFGMLSTAGRCSAFDASADGYVRGEGCGMVVLKRLSEAEADGDRIWGLVRGSAVNQNGAGAGLAVPNGPAQERVMEIALARAGLAPAQVDYLEAHSVGSQLGDPIELNAIAAVYGRERDPQRPLLIGSVKPNIGHVEWAAGIASFIKAVLAINHRSIPGSLNFENPNPNVEWSRAPFRVAAANTDWPDTPGRAPTAAVSAYGLSGANAHVLIEGRAASEGPSANGDRTSFPVSEPRSVPASLPGQVGDLAVQEDAVAGRNVRFLPLSGKSHDALRDLAERYLAHLGDAEGSAADAWLSDLAWTAGVGRSHFTHRAGLVFGDAAQLRQQLRALADGNWPPGRAASPATSRIVLSYPGSGDGWAALAEELYNSEPVARAVLERCEELTREEHGSSLLEAMFKGEGVAGGPANPVWAGPAAYAIACALTAQWNSVGVCADAVAGQGWGVLAAAQAAGATGLDEGLRLTLALGSAVDQAGEQERAAHIEGIAAALGAAGVREPAIPVFDRATGQPLESIAKLDAADWLHIIEHPADDVGCEQAPADPGPDVLVHIGQGPMPGRAIAVDGAEAPGKSTGPSATAGAVDTRRGFVEAVAGAYEAGIDVEFTGLFGGENRRRVPLPSYPFQRRRHWI